MDKSNILSDNSKNSAWFKKQHRDIYDHIMSDYTGSNFAEKLYLWVNDMHEPPACPICGSPLKFRGRKSGYSQYCSMICMHKDPNYHKKVLKNGSPFSRQEVREKARQTCMEHYGVENSFLSEEVREKARRTCMDHYGVENPFMLRSIQERCRKSFEETITKRHQKQWEELPFTEPDWNAVKGTRSVSEAGIRKNHPKLYEYIMENFPNGENFREKLWMYQNNTTTRPVCKICGKPVSFCSNSAEFFTYCSYTCSNRDPDKYGDNNIPGSGTSLELFIRNILDEYDISYTTNDRSILSGKELDIYLPDYKLAIECNGIYWHSSKSSKSKDYHYNKWKTCKEQGIQLLTVWEDQIKNKPSIVRNLILSRLGIYDKKIGARQCIIHDVTPKESRKFLNTHHLQGSVSGSVRLGLYHGNELIALMIFGRTRKSLGQKSHDNTYELYRYCCKSGVHIQGGASKLFAQFLIDHPRCIVESFSSNDISDGTLYRVLGFVHAGEQKGTYWYINMKMERFHRYTFRKDVLIRNGADPNMTEFQITDGMGLFRIYDSGQQKWIFGRR